MKTAAEITQSRMANMAILLDFIEMLPVIYSNGFVARAQNREADRFCL
jgi:hypothetical protein